MALQIGTQDSSHGLGHVKAIKLYRREQRNNLSRARTLLVVSEDGNRRDVSSFRGFGHES